MYSRPHNPQRKMSQRYRLFLCIYDLSFTFSSVHPAYQSCYFAKFQTTFGVFGYFKENIGKRHFLTISDDRMFVQCEVAGECGGCGPDTQPSQWNHPGALRLQLAGEFINAHLVMEELSTTSKQRKSDLQSWLLYQQGKIPTIQTKKFLCEEQEQNHNM